MCVSVDNIEKSTICLPPALLSIGAHRGDLKEMSPSSTRFHHSHTCCDYKQCVCVHCWTNRVLGMRRTQCRKNQDIYCTICDTQRQHTSTKHSNILILCSVFIWVKFMPTVPLFRAVWARTLISLSISQWPFSLPSQPLSFFTHWSPSCLPGSPSSLFHFHLSVSACVHTQIIKCEEKSVKGPMGMLHSGTGQQALLLGQAGAADWNYAIVLLSQ